MTVQWWENVDGCKLAQGDLLPGCLLPLFLGNPGAGGEIVEENLERATLIVLTQSCDLENCKVEHVAMCPVHTLREFEVINPDFRKPAQWENVRKGRREALHLLASPDDPNDNSRCYVVDFSHIVSLPVAYLEKHADSLGRRSRLMSPFLEHFSQAFARFFMRVGLPGSIAKFG